MPPNILHISTHDSGRWFGCYGKQSVQTPNIDHLAEEGLLLENAFAVSPICSPSRGAAMTGLYPQRNGLVGLTHLVSSGICVQGGPHPPQTGVGIVRPGKGPARDEKLCCCPPQMRISSDK